MIHRRAVGGSGYVPCVTIHPAEVYRWIRDSPLDDAATVTVCTGMAEAEALLAFGADPTSARPTEQVVDSGDPFVCTLDVGGAVLAVEVNGFQGSLPEVLTRLSARGAAASMFWNINAVTNIAAARGGSVLIDYEPLGNPDPGTDDPDVLAALEGLDFDDPRYGAECGLVVVERFTGVRFGPRHWAEMEDGVAHPIPV
jgi:hypothetical protein